MEEPSIDQGYMRRREEENLDDTLDELKSRYGGPDAEIAEGERTPDPAPPPQKQPRGEEPEPGEETDLDSRLAEAATRGFEVPGHGLLRGTQSFWSFMDDTATLVSKATGWEKGGVFKDLVRMAEPPPDWTPDNLAEKITSGIFAAGPEIGMITGFPGSAPTVMGYMGGIRGARRGLEEGGVVEAVKHGGLQAGKGFLLGKILNAAGILRKGIRIPTLGAVGGTQAAAEGGGPEEIAEGAAVLGGLGAFSPHEPARPKPRSPSERLTEAIKNAERIEVVPPRSRPAARRAPAQPYPTIEENLAHAEAQAPGFQQQLGEIAQNIGAEATVRVKSPETARGKLQRAGTGPEGITDYLAGRIIGDPYRRAEAVPRALEEKGYEIVEIRDYFNKPNEAGYSGIDILARSPAGDIREVQYHFPELTDVAENTLHKIHEKWRTVAEENSGTIPADRRPEYDTDMAKSRSLAEDARHKYLSRVYREEQQAPEREPVKAEKEKGIPPEAVIPGNSTKVLHGQGSDRAHYALMELDQVQPSHLVAKGFAPNPRYPEKVQERQYHTEKEEQMKVHRNAQMYDPAYTVNSDPTLINGPPAVTKEGIVLGGNSRVMTLDLVYGQHPAKAEIYKQQLKEQADLYGFDPADVENLKNPVLVRVLDEGITGKELPKRIRLYNQSPAQALEAKAEGVSRGRLVSTGTIERLVENLEGYKSLRDYLSSTRSRGLITDLIRDGVIEENQINRMTGKNGLLTEDGKRLVEQMVRGKVIDDADLLGTIPPECLQRLDKSLPALARLKARGGQWDLTEDLKLALDSYARMKASGYKRPSEYLAQLTFTDPDPTINNANATRLLQALTDKKPLELKESFDNLAAAAARDVKGQERLAFYEPETFEEAFGRIFAPESAEAQGRTTGAAEPLSAYETARRRYGDNEALIDQDMEIFNRQTQLRLFDELPELSTGVRTARGKVARSGPGTRDLAVGIREGLTDEGWIDLRGKTARTAEDIATLAQVYRDPRYETLRFIYVKDGRVVAHEGATSRMPGFTQVFRPNEEARFTWRVKDRMRRLGADGYYLVHNHPSGKMEPSPNDLYLTNHLDQKVPGFKGHVIIDSGEYVKIRPDTLENRLSGTEMQPYTVHSLPGAPTRDILLEPSVPHESLGASIKSVQDVAEVGRSIETRPDMTVLLYRSSQGRVRAIQEVPAGLLQDTKHATDVIRGQARRFGAGDVVAYAARREPGRADRLPANVEADLIENGTLLDIVYKPGTSEGRTFSVREEGVEPRRGYKFGKPEEQYAPQRTGEETPAYRIAEEPADLARPLVSEEPPEYRKTAREELFLQPRSGPLPEKAGNINLSRIESTADIKEAIAKTAEIFAPEMQKATRGRVSHEETIRLAEELGMTHDQLLSRREGEAYNPHEALAARCLLVKSASELVKAGEKIHSGEATPMDYLELQKTLSRHSAIEAQVSGMSAEAGRTLNIFKVLASENTSNVLDVRRVLENLEGTETTEAIAEQLSMLKTTDGVNTYVRQLQRARTSDVLLEAWINGLLSNPVTHATNALSNQLVAFWQVPERLLAAEAGRLRKGEREITEGEAVSQAYGLMEGMKDGFRLAWDVLRTGEPSDPKTKLEHRRYRAISSEALELSGNVARAVDLLGEVIRAPGRGLMAGDEFFKAVGYRMELRARAYRRAVVEDGLEGDAAAERIQEVLRDPPQDLHAAAVDAARYQTFTRELTGVSKKVQSAAIQLPPLRVPIPFIRTPTNIMKFVGERTPLAPISKNIRADIKQGGAARDLALARMSLGSLTMAAVATLAAEGLITGGGPKDREMRQALYRKGWQPYSVKIGDKYYSYARLEPLGSLFGLAADATEIIGQMDETSADELAVASVIAVSRNITSKTWLRGASELFEVISDPDRYGDRYVQRLLGSTIPAGVAQVEREADPTLRDARSVLENMQSRIPGYSEDLPPRRNLWGEPIVLGGGLGPDMVSPIYMSEEKASPIDDEMIRLKVGVGMPTEQINEVPLTPEEYSRYVKLAGRAAKDPATGMGCKATLNKLVKSREYKRQSDGPEGGKALMIRETIYDFRDLARKQMLEEYPEIRQLIYEKAALERQKLQPRF